jgi:integrase
MEITRTAGTEKEYTQRAESLLSDYEEDAGLHWRDSPLSSCEWIWLQAFERKWSRATWRKNKNALIFFMRENGPKEAVDFLAATDGSALQSRSTSSTSALKLKKLPQDDLSKIEKEANLTSKWDELLVVWLNSSVLTGLRPSEWDKASLDGNELTVVNAKNSNGRSYAETRRLDISKLKAREKKMIAKTISLIKSSDYQYKEVYSAVRRRLLILTRRIWPTRKLHTTLYSGRHQFRANSVSAGFSKDEVAALMGHASNESAEVHYAHKWIGTGYQDVKPHPDDVATVKKMNAHRVVGLKDGTDISH